MKTKKHASKRIICLALVLSVLFSLSMSGTWQAAAADITFNTLGSGRYYEPSMPMFDGNPDHLDAYLDAYLDWAGLEGACLYATGIRDAYRLTQGARVGWILPGGLAAADNVQGISTDFPALVGLGQTWNKDLVRQIGDVMGTEKMATLLGELTSSRNNHNGRLYDGSGNVPYSRTIAFSVVHDLRINPLSGRIDESFAEDPVLAGSLIDEMAKGFVDIDETDDFYTRGVIGTKHFSVYNAQWYRQTSSTSASARSIYEYNIRSALNGLMSGSLGGVMNSFGRTNGIPNEIAAYNILADNLSKYGMYSSPDFNGENQMYGTSMGNGYDTKYVPDRAHTLALMALAHTESVRASGTDKSDPMALYNMVVSGTYGITEADVRRAAKPLLTQMVRAGLFDEIGENGFSKFYPYINDYQDALNAAGTTLPNFNKAEHQAVAMQAARETAVLLKNDGTLPLSEASSIAVSGILADSRFKTTYAVGTTPNITDSGEAPLLSIVKRYKAANADVVDYDATQDVSFSTGVPVVAIRASNGLYLTAPKGNADAQRPGEFVGGNIEATFDAQDGANPFTDAQLFEVYDWGQSAYSLRSLSNGRWVTAPSNASAAVGNTTRTVLNLTDSDWDLASMSGNTSAIPPRLQLQNNDDGSVTIVTNAYSSGFGGGFERAYWSARFFDVSATNGLISGATTTTQSNTPTASQKFTLNVVKSLSAEIAAEAADKDYAMVFVGALPRNSAGEGADRSSLFMGANDYKLVAEAAAAFAAQGKKTIVVIKASFPVAMEAIQNDPNVAAILYQPYSGQYDGKALAEILYGDCAPTGRLTSTWYSSDDVLPDISKYSIPEGNSYTLEQHDPRIVKDMTNADAYDQSLTYMYCDPADVTYEFGYGLTYTNFVYSNFTVPASASSVAPFTVSVDVKNNGTVDSAEVVQLYANNQNSAYAKANPIRKLVSFQKVAIPAGQTRTVSLTVKPFDLEIWDVNAGKYIVESGRYELMVGASSEDIKAQGGVMVTGESLTGADVKDGVNVFDHAYAANNVVYNEVSKVNTAQSLKAGLINGGYSAVMSKGAGAWVAIPNVNLSGATGARLSVASTNESSTFELRVGTPTGLKLGSCNFAATAPVTRDIPGGAANAIHELGYTDVNIVFENTYNGVDDLYIVFGGADIRVDCVRFTYPVQGISLTGTAVRSLRKGKTYDLGADLVVTPLDVLHTEKITWSSSNPAVLQVNAATGLALGVKSGTAVVTAKTADGSIKASVVFTVTM